MIYGKMNIRLLKPYKQFIIYIQSNRLIDLQILDKGERSRLPFSASDLIVFLYTIFIDIRISL